MPQSHAYIHGMAVLVVATLLAGCGQEPSRRIDANSHYGEPGSQSWIEESLPAEERIRFRVAVDEHTAPYLALLDIDKEQSEEVELAQRFMELAAESSAKLHRKTAAEIIRMYEPAVSRRIERERPELDALVAKETAALAARSELNQFTILDAKLIPGHLGRRIDFRLELRVRNNTPHVVVSAEYRATLASPEHRLPWREEDVTDYFSGGLEPGEETTTSVILDRVWGVTRADGNAVMTVVPLALFGPESTPLFPQMAKWDRERLEKLRYLYTP